MKLVFKPERLSRTLTRSEWQDIWRWKRLTEKRLARSLEEQIALLSIYGTTMPAKVRSDIIDVIVNPPLMIYPFPKDQIIGLRPGGIYYVH